ncbi:MAG: FAD-dependent oxidoreductase [Patescibacteria group bacterium]
MSAELKKYDLIIVGAGPAGLTASVYASRYKVKHLIIAKLTGGIATEAHWVCNFPSEKNISGADLMAKVEDQARSLGGQILSGEVSDIEKKSGGFLVTLAGGKSFLAQKILLASGTKRRRLNLASEKKFIGKGVSYCAACDAFFYRQKTVAVVGGSDSANTAALYLAKVAKKVYQIYRGEKLRGDQTWVEQVLSDPKIEVVFGTNIVDFKGNTKLESVLLDRPFQGSQELKLDGVFLEIGAEPETEFFRSTGVDRDARGYIMVNKNQSTSISGIWAAGDITNGSNNFHQVVTACSEGAVAVQSIFLSLQQEKQKFK